MKLVLEGQLTVDGSDVYVNGMYLHEILRASFPRESYQAKITIEVAGEVDSDGNVVKPVPWDDFSGTLEQYGDYCRQLSS